MGVAAMVRYARRHSLVFARWRSTCRSIFAQAMHPERKPRTSPAIRMVCRHPSTRRAPLMRLLVPASATSSACAARLRVLQRLSALIFRVKGMTPPGGSERTRRIIVAASVFVGCALAALVLFVGGRAVVDALLHDDAADDTAAVVDGASEDASAQRCVARMAEQGNHLDRRLRVLHRSGRRRLRLCLPLR